MGVPRALPCSELQSVPGLDQRRHAGGEGVGQAGGAAGQRAVGGNRAYDQAAYGQAGNPAGYIADPAASARRGGPDEGGRVRASQQTMVTRGDPPLHARTREGLQQLQGAPEGPAAKAHSHRAAPAPQGTLAERRLLRQYQAALRVARRRQGSPSRAWADPEPGLRAGGVSGYGHGGGDARAQGSAGAGTGAGVRRAHGDRQGPHVAGTGSGLGGAQRPSPPAALPQHAGARLSDARLAERPHHPPASAGVDGLDDQQAASSPATVLSIPLDRERWHALPAGRDAATALASSDAAPASAAAILQAGTFGGVVGPVAQRRASAAATSQAEPDRLSGAPAALERPSLGSAGQTVGGVFEGAPAVERTSDVGASLPDTPLRGSSSDAELAPVVRTSEAGPVLSRSASAAQRAPVASISLPGSVFSRPTSFNNDGAVKVLGAPSGAARGGGPGPVPVQGRDPGEGMEKGGPSPVSVLSSMALQQAPLALDSKDAIG